MGPLLRTPAQGIDTITWLATDRNARAGGGRLFHDRRVRLFDRLPTTRLTAEDRLRLWAEVVRLAGMADPVPDGPSR